MKRLLDKYNMKVPHLRPRRRLHNIVLEDLRAISYEDIKWI